MKQSVAIVILNWNGKEHLSTFLPSVVKHSAKEAKVYVVDNGSSDDSMNIAKAYPEIECIYLDKNHGFSKGYNLGLQQIEATTYVLLNSDVQVSENWISPVLNYMEEHQLTACQPKVLSYKQPDHFEYAGATGGFLDKDGFVFCAGRIFDHHEKDQGQYDENKEVFWASGASLFINAKAYHEVGGLDEDFFAHMEEIDLCWRLKNRGYRIGSCSNSKVYHLGGGTLNKVNPFKTFLNFRNSLFMLTKNEFNTPLIWRIFRRLCLDGIAGIRFIFEGNWVYTKAVLKAHFSYYRMLGKMLKKRDLERKALHPDRNRIGRFKKSILVAYYLQKKTVFTALDQEDFHS